MKDAPFGKAILVGGKYVFFSDPEFKVCKDEGFN